MTEFREQFAADAFCPLLEQILRAGSVGLLF
jgi:hypothetical protein